MDEERQFTCVTLRSGRTVIVRGSEWHRVDAELYVYPDCSDHREVLFNWGAVEYIQVKSETELREDMADALDAYEQLSDTVQPERDAGGQYI